MASLSISEASLTLGISQDVVRRKVRSGEIPGKQVPAPGGFKWLVEIGEPGDPEQATAPDRRDMRIGPNDRGRPQAAHIDGLQEVMQARIDSLEMELERRAHEINQLHQLMAARALNPAPMRAWWQFWR